MKKTLRYSMMISLLGACLANPVMAESSLNLFKHKEKSTIDTIKLKAIDQDELSEAVIEGGLEPTSAGPVSAAESVPAYQERALAEPLDKQTDMGRHEIPVDIVFQNQRSIPGQVHTGNYRIEVPTNRTYQEFNFNTTAR